MSAIIVRARQRRALRRRFRSRCQAVALDQFRLVGERVLDLSTRGMLLACDQRVELGDDLLVTFPAPEIEDGAEQPIWIDAEAEVTRRIGGFRAGDLGYCVGLRFTRMDRASRDELLARLAGLPPPVPQRLPRADYAETVRRIATFG